MLKIVGQSGTGLPFFIHGHERKKQADGRIKNFLKKGKTFYGMKWIIHQKTPRIHFGSRVFDTPGCKKMHRFQIPQLLFMGIALYFILSSDGEPAKDAICPVCLNTHRRKT